jgi:hypothetical protein
LAKECDDALIFIDASIVSANRASSGSKRGRYKKLLTVHEAVARAMLATPPRTIPISTPCATSPNASFAK